MMTSLSNIQLVDAGLWALAMLEYVIGDIGTTLIGLQHQLQEAHPILDTVVAQYGLFGMLIGKAIALLLCGGLYWASPDDISRGVPIGLFLVGIAIVTWNLFLIQLWRALIPVQQALYWLIDLLVF